MGDVAGLGGAAVGGMRARASRASAGRPASRAVSCGLASGRLSTSHSGIPAHGAMNGTASSTLIPEHGGHGVLATDSPTTPGSGTRRPLLVIDP